MATAAKIIDAPSTDIAVVVAQTPAVVLVDREKCEELYAHIQREVDAFEPDLTTAKGRDAIKSLAFKITRTKTAIDAAGKQLNEDARAQINAVDAARRDAREKLDAMAKAVRQPLTDWEAAEEERVAWCNQVIADLKAGAVVTMDDTAETVRARGKAAWEVIVKPETFGELFETAQSVKDTTVGLLKSALERLTKEEADRAELEKLRAEKEERDAREAEELAAREAVEAKRKWARQIIDYIGEVGLGMIGGKTYPYVILIRELEEKITVSEKEFGDMAGDVEKARVETLARVKEAQAAQAEREQKEAAEAAAEVARRAAIAEAEEAAAEKDRLYADALAEEKRLREKAQADALAERNRIAEEAAAARAKEEAEAAAKAEREADQAHKGRVMKAAKEAIMTCGADEETAKKIVLAIVGGMVPHVSLEF